MIKQLEQETKGGAGGNMNPMRPMADSKLGGGPGGVHELTDPKASEKQWGNLSPKHAIRFSSPRPMASRRAMERCCKAITSGWRPSR